MVLCDNNAMLRMRTGLLLHRIGSFLVHGCTVDVTLIFGDTANCMYSYNIIMTWREWECVSYEMSCPCIYPSQPILRF